MKKLTGNAKVHFEYWLQTEMIVLPENGVESLGDLFLNALIIEWLDSVGIFITVYPNITETPIPYSYHIKSVCHKGSRMIKHDRYHYYASRNDAASAAITKSVELFNERA